MLIGTATTPLTASLVRPVETVHGQLLAFPIVSTVTLASLTTAVPGVSDVYGGCFSLRFAYVGLFLPAWGSVAFLGRALLTYFVTL